MACQTAVMAMQDISELGTILSIWAHPDDEAYLCGGIMAMATEAGSRVVCATATRGELGRHPDHIAVHYWTADAVRQTGIGALHVSVNTQDWLDEHGARFLKLGVIVGEPPVAWLDTLSIDLKLRPAILDRKLAALAAQASQTEAFRAAAGEDYYRLVIGSERFGRLRVWRQESMAA